MFYESAVPLSNEDNLRLNVLLAQKPHVIRINESNMTLYALTAKGEVAIKLNPTARDEAYLRAVRELLSMKVTGSPGGYPIFIKRWTRMGHTHNTLEHMLLLGEPEAVTAVAYSNDLTHEIARRVWWANPNTDIARQLLRHESVVQGDLGKELTEFLMEFLPFEERQLDIVNTIRLCLQGDLMTEEERLNLWKRAKRKNPYYVGFMHADPALIPEKKKPSAHAEIVQSQLASLLDKQNIYAETLVYLLSETGQKWLTTLKYSLHKPVDQDVIISLFIAIDQHFSIPFEKARGVRHLEDGIELAKKYCDMQSDCPDDLKAVIQALDDKYINLLEAVLVLSQLGEDTLIPIFSGNDSVGAVMRKRLSPLTTPILERIDILMS